MRRFLAQDAERLKLPFSNVVVATPSTNSSVCDAQNSQPVISLSAAASAACASSGRLVALWLLSSQTPVGVGGVAESRRVPPDGNGREQVARRHDYSLYSSGLAEHPSTDWSRVVTRAALRETRDALLRCRALQRWLQENACSSGCKTSVRRPGALSCRMVRANM